MSGTVANNSFFSCQATNGAIFFVFNKGSGSITNNYFFNLTGNGGIFVQNMISALISFNRFESVQLSDPCIEGYVNGSIVNNSIISSTVPSFIFSQASSTYNKCNFMD